MISYINKILRVIRHPQDNYYDKKKLSGNKPCKIITSIVRLYASRNEEKPCECSALHILQTQFPGFSVSANKISR